MKRSAMLTMVLFSIALGGCAGTHLETGKGAWLTFTSSTTLEVMKAPVTHSMGLGETANIIARREPNSPMGQEAPAGMVAINIPTVSYEDEKKTPEKTYKYYDEQTQTHKIVPWDELPAEYKKAYASSNSIPSTW
jgi:hypothetical protein